MCASSMRAWAYSLCTHESGHDWVMSYAAEVSGVSSMRSGAVHASMRTKPWLEAGRARQDARSLQWGLCFARTSPLRSHARVWLRIALALHTEPPGARNRLSGECPAT